MLPVLALLSPAADPGARFEAYMRARPAFTATLQAGAGDVSLAVTLRIVRPNRLRFDAKGKGVDYTVVSTPETFREIDRIGKVYDERTSIGGFRVYDSRISGAGRLMPFFLLSSSIAGLFAGVAPKVAPVTGGDELSGTIATQEGSITRRLVVDPQGKPIRFVDGERIWKVGTVNSGADAATFAVGVPLGYVPFALPELSEPLAIGQPAPLAGWRQGGRTIDLGEVQRGRPRLLAVLDAESTASRTARVSLAALGKTMPVLVIAPDSITDPSGKLLKRLSPPGTPMFYLVGGNGVVRNLWLGYDPARAAAWEAEVRAAAKAAEMPQ